MDDLSQLPTSTEQNLNNNEKSVLKNYFNISVNSKENAWSSVYIILLYLLLTNSMFDNMLCRVPYCENYLYIVKLLVFSIAVYLILTYT